MSLATVPWVDMLMNGMGIVERRPQVSGFSFEVGQLVRHKRYGYRGVVAACDRSCRAGDTWFFSNQTQPSRSQPWYHIVVHGAKHTTYVAEENIREDKGGEQVINPYTRGLFAYFNSGRYQPRKGVAVTASR